MTNFQSLAYYWPELIITVAVIVALVADLLLTREGSWKVSYWALGGLVLALIAVALTGNSTVTTLFMDSIALDPFGQFFKTVVILATVLVVLVTISSQELAHRPLGEYFVLMLIMVLGMFLMVSSIDLVMVYLAIEIVSIMSFILAGYLKDTRLSNEASLKYVIYGAFSSGIMLFGLSIIFGLAGSTKFFAIREAIQGLEGEANFALILASVFVLAGFGYKISAVPFHFWTPDVYEGSPTAITAYLSVAPKAAGFALLIRFFNQVLGGAGSLAGPTWLPALDLPWPQLLAILSAVTMSLGNLVAIQQSSVKRMLAYSSIAHAGYMMMALPLLSSRGVFAIMLYLVMYLFMNLGAFFVVIHVQDRLGGAKLEDFQGLGWKMPLVGVVMGVFMFSLTGLPPTAGFIAKFYIFAAVIEAGPGFYWLVLVGAINSVISLYYYVRVLKHMFLEGQPSTTLAYPSRLMTVLLIVLAVPTLLFGVYWAPVANWVTNSMNLFTRVM